MITEKSGQLPEGDSDDEDKEPVAIQSNAQTRQFLVVQN